MRDIDTDALGSVAAALGIGNPATATRPTEFDDGVLQQVLDVSTLVNRGRLQNLNDGLGVIVLETEHGGAGTTSDSVEAFAQDGGANANVNAPWPQQDIFEGKYDLWYIDSFGYVNGATGVLTAAELIIQYNNEPGLFTTTYTAGGVVQRLLNYWTLETAFGRLMGPSAIEVVRPHPFRISRATQGSGNPPSATFTFQSTSTGAAAYVAAVRVALSGPGLPPLAF